MDHDSQDELPYTRSLKRKAEKHDMKALKKNKCRASKAKWTQEEDDILTKAVMLNGEGNWKKIAQSLNDRSHLQCLHRWQKVLNPALVKGPWKEEEDLKLVELVEKYGPKDWSTIASHIQGRIGKQCRERWFNHLSPEVRKTNWTPEEDQIIIEAHQRLGNKWTAISKLLNGRPANAIKNHWNSTLLKRIQIDSNGQSMTPRRERSKISKHKHVGDIKDGIVDQLIQDESDPQSSPESPTQMVPQSSPTISIISRPIPITPLPQSSAYFPLHGYTHSSQFPSLSLSTHTQDPSLVLFGDQQVLSWDWPTSSPHSSGLNQSVSPVSPLSMGMGVGMGGIVTSGTISNGCSNTIGGMGIGMGMGMGVGLMAISSGPGSVEYGLGLVDHAADFMDMYQTQQAPPDLPEFQFCFDEMSPSNVLSRSPVTPGIDDGTYSPMSLDTTAASMNMNMNLLNLEMPGIYPLQLDI